jgi:hypothetical protein
LVFPRGARPARAGRAWGGWLCRAVAWLVALVAVAHPERASVATVTAAGIGVRMSEHGNDRR